jgi:hypothetical protein
VTGRSSLTLRRRCGARAVSTICFTLESGMLIELRYHNKTNLILETQRGLLIHVTQ